MTADVVLPLRATPNKPGRLVRCLALSACVVAAGVDVLTLSVTLPFRLGSSWDVTMYGYGEIISQSATAPDEGQVVGLGDTSVTAPSFGPAWGASLSLQLLFP